MYRGRKRLVHTKPLEKPSVYWPDKQGVHTKALEPTADKAEVVGGIRFEPGVSAENAKFWVMGLNL